MNFFNNDFETPPPKPIEDRGGVRSEQHDSCDVAETSFDRVVDVDDDATMNEPAIDEPRRPMRSNKGVPPDRYGY